MKEIIKKKLRKLLVCLGQLNITHEEESWCRVRVWTRFFKFYLRRYLSLSLSKSNSRVHRRAWQPRRHYRSRDSASWVTCRRSCPCVRASRWSLRHRNRRLDTRPCARVSTESTRSRSRTTCPCRPLPRIDRANSSSSDVAASWLDHQRCCPPAMTRRYSTVLRLLLLLL